MRPLTAIRLLALSRFVARPFCCQILGDNGADAVKVEKPDDELAHQMPAFAQGESLCSIAYHGSKRGITPNFRSPEGLTLIQRLLEKADSDTTLLLPMGDS